MSGIEGGDFWVVADSLKKREKRRCVGISHRQMNW
jgi:hypothetical protein